MHFRLFEFQGAERKTRDEERRAAKRKMTATGRKKLDELYHSVTERSEFYSMADIHKPPVLFSPPAEHPIDKVTFLYLFFNFDHLNFFRNIESIEKPILYLKKGYFVYRKNLRPQFLYFRFLMFIFQKKFAPQNTRRKFLISLDCIFIRNSVDMLLSKKLYNNWYFKIFGIID